MEMTYSEIFIQKYSDFPVNEREVLRYAGCQGADEDSDVVRMARDCISEACRPGVFNFSICYRRLSVLNVDTNNNIDFGLLKTKSADLADLMCGCSDAIFIAATVGHEIDRIINKYKRFDPAKALFMQAIGAERIETMLDEFCADKDVIIGSVFANNSHENTIKYVLTPRFSPGYGDLSLAIQPEFLGVLDASRKIGITLNDSLLMSPSKSVTAIVGVKEV